VANNDVNETRIKRWAARFDDGSGTRYSSCQYSERHRGAMTYPLLMKTTCTAVNRRQSSPSAHECRTSSLQAPAGLRSRVCK